MSDKAAIPATFEQWEAELMANLDTMSDGQIEQILKRLEMQNMYGGYDNLIWKLKYYLEND